MNTPINALLIEDNPGDARLVKEELRAVNSKTVVQLEWVDRLEKGLERIAANRFDAVLLDLSLPDGEGLNTLWRVLSHAPQIPVIVMTGQVDEELAIRALQSGAEDYLIKGQVDGRLLRRSIQYSIERKHAERQIIQMKRLYATLSQVNQTIVHVRSQEELYQSICDVAVQFGEFTLAWIGLLDEATGDVHPVTAQGLDVRQWPFQLVNINTGPVVDGLTAIAIRTSRVVTSDDLQSDDTMQSAHEIFEAYGYHAAAVVPFQLRDKTIGVLNLVSPQAGFFQSPEEIQLLEEMGLDISFALDRMESEAERKRAEEKLEDLQNRMSGIVESAMDAIISVNANQQIVLANSAAEQMFGYNTGEMIGKPLESLLPERFRAVHVEQVRQFGMTGETNRSMNALGAVRGLRAGGEEFPAEASISQISVGADKMYTVILRDITERKRAEAQIQRQLKRMNSLRMIDIAISSSFDMSLVLEVVLQEVHSQLGVDACAVVLFNAQLQGIEYPASRGFRSETLHHTHLKLGEGYASQAVLKRKTIHISALMQTGGKLAKALQSAKEEFVEYYGAPLIVKGEVKGALEIYHRSHLKVDAEWLEFLEALAGQAAIAIDNAQLFEGLQRSNASLERHVAERTAELNRSNVELEHANRTKDEFLANMSHELRTPLTSILGLSEALLEQRRGSLSDYQERSIQIIESSGQHLLELINDILDLSKIEAGKFDFYPQPISVDEICRASLTFIKTQAAKKSITVTHTNEASASQIYADPRRLKQILVNLLTNAVKFTPQNGQVTLQVNGDLAQDLIQFSVIDNGIGISAENLKRLFQPFVQVDSSLNRQHEGTGLGLALVQRLTDLHGGSLQVESEVGKGSRFTINLACKLDEIAKLEALKSQTAPVVRAQAERTEAMSEGPIRREVVLLAEDNMSNVLTIGEYLKSHDYEIVVAHDGLEAIKLAEEVNPAIILMDVQMPVMNGLEAIARLRDNSRFAPTPIIALTALAMSGDRERCLAAGASEYMSKPVSLKVLANTIRGLLDG